MTNRIQNREFTLEIHSLGFLDDAIEWISMNLPIEDVFPRGELEEWAQDNGYVKETEQ